MRAALVAIVGIVLLALCAVLVTTLGHDLLPVIVVNGDYSRLVDYGISPAVLALTVLALAALWRRRSGTVLDLWLLVVLCTWLCDVALSAVIGSARYDLGWYGGRTFGLVAASFVLGALLVEMNNLYGKLAEAVTEADAQNLALATSRAQLVQVQRLEAIGRLTGGIAHDFNNLLTAIVGGLDMIIRRPEDTERVARLAKNAMTAAERSAQLINQLLTFARKQSLRPEVLNPNTVLTEFQMLARRAVGDAIEVRQNFDPALHLVRIDAAEFQSAILNLITNARDAMPSGGTLTIATRNVEIDERLARQIPDLVPGHYAVVTVADTGTGMDSAVQAQVFEPFFTTKPVGKGTGLGLSQVYGFAQSAGGHVVIASKVGVGTSVELYLPRSGGQAVSQMAAFDFPLRQARPGETVLLVEDDVDVMRATAESLNELGYKVLTAANGAEGLRALTDQQRIDILFSDVVMPGGMNGVQLAVEARRVRPHLRVLLTSGYTGAALQAHGVPEDLQLLAKPYRREELAQKLRLVLGDAGQKDG
jgi:signal transduction histidine kinase/CheY-like chemotaxis protein